MKQKYVRLRQYNQFIIFHEATPHSKFKHFDVISAGFCYINAQTMIVSCFGESVSLELKSLEDDTEKASKQIFGMNSGI